MLKRRDVVRDHLSALFALKIRASQTGFVSPNEKTLAQHPYEPGSDVWGLWDGNTPVGLLAMIDPRVEGADLNDGDDPEAAYVWRLMIGAEHQGKGYGTAAINEAINVAREWKLPRVCLTCVDEPGSAIAFYQKLGFKPTGRVVHDECEMMRDV